jgi:probable HAF family extracellular repeat protein
MALPNFARLATSMARAIQRTKLARHSAPRRFRPACVALEDRCLPSYSFTTLDVPGAMQTSSQGINDLGQIVGQFVDASNRFVGFLYSDGSYTPLDVPNSVGTSANGINNAGQVVGAYSNGLFMGHGFLFSDGAYTTLDFPGRLNTAAEGLNNADQIVGVFSEGSASVAFLYSGGVYSRLEPSGATESLAFGINDAGLVVGWYTPAGSSNGLGFVYDHGNFTTLQVSGAVWTNALGINNSGQVVGAYLAGGSVHGFILSAGIYTTLDVPGATTTDVFGINDSGEIVGSYRDASLHLHAFLATPVQRPEVTCSVEDRLLWPANHHLVNVGLSVVVNPPDASLQFQVYANDHADSSDVAHIGPDTLRLRAERTSHGFGRAYLIVVTASNEAGSAFDVCTVVVPRHHDAIDIAIVRLEAVFANRWYRHFQTAPPGFHLVGEVPEGPGPAPSGISASQGRSAFAAAIALPEAAKVPNLWRAGGQNATSSTANALTLPAILPVVFEALTVDRYFAAPAPALPLYSWCGPQPTAGGGENWLRPDNFGLLRSDDRPFVCAACY